MPATRLGGRETYRPEGSGQRSGPRPTAESHPSRVPLPCHRWRFCGRLLRLDDRGDSPRPDDDDPGTGAVLRRHVPLEVRAQHDDDVLHRARHRRHRLRRCGAGRWPSPARRRHLFANPFDAWALDGVPLGELHRRRHVPDDVRGHHGGADLGCDRRPREALGLGALRADLGHARATSRSPTRCGATGVGFVSKHFGAQDYAGGTVGAHQRRYRGPGARADHRQARSASAGSRCARTT